MLYYNQTSIYNRNNTLEEPDGSALRSQLALSDFSETPSQGKAQLSTSTEK